MTSEGDAVATASLDLPALKAKVEALSDQIRDLKASGSDAAKDQIPPLVKEMLAAKKAYADGNGGIGVDGKPYEEPLSKSEKKKREKAAKAAAAAAAAGGGADGADGEPKADPNSKGSQKKAAKKAEKAAKKAAAKAAAKGGAPPPAAPAKAGKAAAAAAKPATAKKPAACRPAAIGTKSKIPPHTLSFSPNAALTDRPVVALAVAVLTNTVQDYGINSDHTRMAGPGLGLPKPKGGTGINGGEICGDVTIARYVARRAARRSRRIRRRHRRGSYRRGRRCRRGRHHRPVC